MPGPAGHLVDGQLLHRRRRQQLQADLHQLGPPVAGRAPQPGGSRSGGGGHRRQAAVRSAVAAASSRSIASATSCGRSWVSMCPVRSTTCSVGVGQRLGQLPAVPLRRELVAVADEDLDRHAGERRELLALVVVAERRA